MATYTLEPRAYDRTLPSKLGVLEAAGQRRLAFEVAGRLIEIAAEGTRVGADDVIARLDSDVESAQARQAELMLAEATSNLERVRGLDRSRAVSAKDVEAAEMQVALRRSELAVARERLLRRQLVAGIDGVVVGVEPEIGELVTPQSVVATVLDRSELKLVVGVPGYQVAQIDAGGRAFVHVPDAGVERLEGRIERVAEAALPGQHLFEVEIRVPDPTALPGSPRVLPGMNARAKLVAESIPRALVVPLEAMVEREGRRVVFFVDDGRAVTVNVGDAPLVGEELLLPGDLPYRELVVRGQHDLIGGEPVQVDNGVLQDWRPT